MFTLLSVHFFDSSLDILIEKIRNKIIHNEHIYVCVTGLHGLFVAQRNKSFQKILNGSGFTVCDGMPIVVFEKIIKKLKIQRIYGPDLMVRVCKMAETNTKSIFLFGTTNETLIQLSLQIKKRFPRLIIAGTYAPPFQKFSGKENKKIYFLINSSRASIVLVGLSTPKQEQWMYAAQHALSANMLLGVGAAFDFVAGTKKQAPVWMRTVGLEWFFRFVHEPKRLGKRYATIIVALFRLGIRTAYSKIKQILFS